MTGEVKAESNKIGLNSTNREWKPYIGFPDFTDEIIEMVSTGSWYEKFVNYISSNHFGKYLHQIVMEYLL